MKQLTTIMTMTILILTLNTLAFAGDFYVDAVNGDNANSGTSADEAFKTITHALSRVEGTEAHPAVINIAEGTYNMDLGESFPIEVKGNISIRGTGMDKTIIDASERGKRVMDIDYVANVLVEKLTITGGKESSAFGGGIYIDNSDAIIKECKITGNYAFYGGGICGYAPASKVIDCIISNNRAKEGGGVYIIFLTLKNCIIENNITGAEFEYTEGVGGGISVVYEYSRIAVFILDCTIRNNKASLGGGISCSNSQSVIKRCVIENNYAERSGGGIMFYKDPFSTMTDCKIINNSSRCGSGINCNISNPNISDCIIANNTGIENESDQSYGGGIYLVDCTPSIINCIIKENSVDVGGGVYFCKSSPTLTNIIIEGNTAQNDEKIGCGGAMYCYKNSYPTFKNSLFIRNSADYHSVFYGHESAKLSFFYSTIADNSPKSTEALYVDSDSTIVIVSSILWGNGEKQIQGPAKVEYSNIQGGYEGNGNIDSDPLFVSGPWGDYYLSSREAGQDFESPCLDTGKEDWSYDKPEEMTTRTDGIFDKGDVDMGYHHPPHIQFWLYKSPNKLKFKAGDSVEILMDLKTAPKAIIADIYLIMVDPESKVWSGFDCSMGLKPSALNFSFPGDLSVRNVPLWIFTMPSSNPPIQIPGIYTFYIGAAQPGTGEFISNLATLKMEVY